VATRNSQVSRDLYLQVYRVTPKEQDEKAFFGIATAAVRGSFIKRSPIPPYDGLIVAIWKI
jgi:hypothetical protein